MINFSIIIPHKNIPDLLERCLKSIPQRDDLQVIVVDDDSEIPARHCGNDGRVEFIFAKDEKRSGAGFARNIGLEHAKGRWIIFADADDFFNSPAFENALDKYADSDADMICFANNSLNSDDLTVKENNFWSEMCERIKACKQEGNLDTIRYNAPVIWARFFKRSFVERIGARCQEVVVSNDVFFAVQTGCMADKIQLDENEIYCYTKRKNSLMSIVRTKEIQWESYWVTKHCMQFLRKQGKGFDVLNTFFIRKYENLAVHNKLLFLKEFPSAFLLTSTRFWCFKMLVNFFLKPNKAKY
jgi:glycosyltransferase involved in cell wall biosynthesis